MEEVELTNSRLWDILCKIYYGGVLFFVFVCGGFFDVCLFSLFICFSFRHHSPVEGTEVDTGFSKVSQLYLLLLSKEMGKLKLFVPEQ